jgi:molybdenum cofactor sulfurtransferase
MTVDRRPRFRYLRDNHTSIVGLRGTLAEAGYDCQPVTAATLSHWASQGAALQPPPSPSSCEDQLPPDLVAYPLQCNLSGHRYPLQWATDLAKCTLEGTLPPTDAAPSPPRQALVFVDVASYAATSPPRLAQVDFAALSFYKLFGLPTGAGALVVRRSAAQRLPLRSAYFGGGAVAAYSAEDTSLRQDQEALHARLEHGTQPYLELAAVVDGFAAMEELWPARSLALHVQAVTRYAARELSNLCHGKGRPAVRLLGTEGVDEEDAHGPILAFHVLDEIDQVVSPNEVAALAAAHNIHLRAGCQCNTGACHRLAGVQPAVYRAAVAKGHVCGGPADITADGAALGVLRISFGGPSRVADVDALVALLRRYYIVKDGTDTCEPEAAVNESGAPPNGVSRPQRFLSCSRVLGASGATLTQAVTLASLHVYPVKSCAAFSPQSWPLTAAGALRYDRVWMVVDPATGAALTQKQCSRLSLVRPRLELDAGCLTLSDASASQQAPLQLPLRRVHAASPGPTSRLQVPYKVCSDRVGAHDEGDTAAIWLERILQRPCRLVRSLDQRDDGCDAASGDGDGRSGGDGRAGNSAGDEAGSEAGQRVDGVVGSRQCRAPRETAVGDDVGPVPAPAFSNEAPLLMVNEASLRVLNDRAAIQVPINRFRANLVVSSDAPFAEDVWSLLELSPQGEEHATDRPPTARLRVTGPCRRCQMVCVDQDTGERTTEPLAALSQWRMRAVRRGSLTNAS